MSITLIPLVIIVVGLAAGAAVASRIGRKEKGPSASDLHDLELVISDLERERDETYDRLRGSESIELTEEDRRALEERAARSLMRLEELQGERREKFGAPKSKRRPSSDSREGKQEVRGGFASQHPLLAGTALGGGLVGVVALLIFWAQRDARPAPQQTSGPMAQQSAPAGPGQTDERGQPPLPPFLAGEVQRLTGELTGGEEDLEIHRELAGIYLSTQRFTDAFSTSEAILAIAPEDSEGLYIQGMVRYMMGQPGEAFDMLDRALASDPANTQASMLKGIFMLQMEDREGATATWRKGLEAAGGTAPRLEHLINLTEQGLSPEEILNTPPPAESGS